MTVHRFADSLAYSHSEADAPYWLEVYQQAFPDMVDMIDLRSHGWHQKAGRDRAIVLSTGRSLYVDEKVRKKVYDDISVEVWSVYPRDGHQPWRPVAGAQPGWAVTPKDCDYLAYAFKPTQTCHLFPYFSIRAAWTKHGGTWIAKAQADEDGYRWVAADNRDWWTVSIAVPTQAFRAYIEDSLTITWSSYDH